MLSVKDIRVAGTGNGPMRHLLPTQAGDEPPRYIFHSHRRIWVRDLRSPDPALGDGAWIPRSPLPGFRPSPEYMC